jgi:hypothetical protein
LAAVCGLSVVACGERVPNERAVTSADVCQSDFERCVMPVLSGQIKRRGGATISCSDGNCHAAGGSGGRFSLGSDVNANFLAAKNFINLTSPDDSVLLVEPTQDDVAPSAGAGTHGGGEIFPSRSDACYLAIRNWASNQVADQTSPACGTCTPIASTFASCGYP